MAPTFRVPSDDPARSRASDIAEHIRRAIVSGEFAPNERLVEQELAKDLNTNRAVIRAAFAHLEHQRWLVREPNRGVRVRTYTAQEAAEILEARAALEGLVARYAARRIDGEGERTLRGIIAEMKACHDSGDPLAYSQLNAKLHRTILEIANHETAAMLLSSLQSQAVRYQFRTVLQPGRITQSLREHEAIVQAVLAHDEDDAERAMRVHIGSVVRTVLAIAGSGSNALKAM
ncbi:MAG TPA: GntR family transcriptional regulator [Candidatus Baltobacteraceae bacterium]|nr:GntR family transcriptional regulator [Candidatus Baltobacteraceae bacterium]